MINKNLISSQIIPLKLGGAKNTALQYMQENQISHIPVVSQGKYIGLINANLLHENKPELEITERNIFSIAAAKPEDQFIRLWSMMLKNEISCLPIVNLDNSYIGCVTKPDLIRYFCQNFSTQEPGSVLVLSIRRLDYSLVLLSQIVEEHNGIILSSFITEPSDENEILVTLRINKEDPQAIINHFYRHEIEIKSVFSDGVYVDLFKDRYDEFMHFLNV
ncbi:MAG: CBS domain-containing protein [Saprospiraceae bacterium]|nr:CBS domain-containing protein [Saprospiraceae bacterium]HRG32007.1 CBS domain-containing protein [Saprospiraceae bacterium]